MSIEHIGLIYTLIHILIEPKGALCITESEIYDKMPIYHRQNWENI